MIGMWFLISTIVKKMKLMDSFLIKKKTLPETLARMTALDGLPFSVFCTSTDLRMALASVGFTDKLPQSPNTIRKIVLEYAQSTRSQQIVEIGQLQKNGERFSIVFDEWTSNSNRRYINMILKSQTAKLWNIGLMRKIGRAHV